MKMPASLQVASLTPTFIEETCCPEQLEFITEDYLYTDLQLKSLTLDTNKECY